MAAYPRVLSLCSGYGGLDLAVRRVFPTARTVCYVEREVSCVRVLAARMEDGSLDPAPVWDDVSTFDPEPWAGAVDLVVAGFPCQPHSVAGKREGIKDDRWPVWDDVIRIARGCSARSIFLENVPGLLTSSGGASIGKVKSDLEYAGFSRCADIVVSAGSVGAHFGGARWFCLGTTDGDGLPREFRQWTENRDKRRQGANLVQTARRAFATDMPAAPCIFGVADGVAERMDTRDRIRLLGNGVVPLQAAIALQALMEALEDT